jgi:hypothetical protein
MISIAVSQYFFLHWLFTHYFSATKQAHSNASTSSASRAATPKSLHSPTIEEVEGEDGPTSAPGTGDWNSHKRLNSNRLPVRRPQKQQIIITSDKENEDAESTGTDNAVSHVRKGFSSGVCLSVLSKSKLNTIARFTQEHRSITITRCGSASPRRYQDY